jgi:hypothetical protein
MNKINRQGADYPLAELCGLCLSQRQAGAWARAKEMESQPCNNQGRFSFKKFYKIF